MARFTLTDCDEYGQTYETWEGETLEDARDMLDSLKTAEEEATGWRCYGIRAAIADLEDQIADEVEWQARLQEIAEMVFP